MSTHVLLNLLNGLRKRDKIRGVPSIYQLFTTSLINSINTGEQLLDSIYHMTLRLL